MIMVKGCRCARGRSYKCSWPTLQAPQTRYTSSQAKVLPPWRPASVLDNYVERPIRPISLRQLFFFGRTLTESRLLSSANYVRSELPTRIAHRLRDMQKLPYVVVTNPHLSVVYELYYKAFETMRRIPLIKNIEENDGFCTTINSTLKEHLAAIPNLVIGVLECQDLVHPDIMEGFINTMLRARISRRVIAEQHLALTETFNSPWHSPGKQSESDFVGEVLLRCNAREIIKQSGELAQQLSRGATDSESAIPDINISGNLEATFPYIQSHLEYIVGELLRNSILAVMERNHGSSLRPPPIEVLICEAPQHVVIRISDQGGGIHRDIIPYLWSFNKGPENAERLRNLEKVPKLAATVNELQGFSPFLRVPGNDHLPEKRRDSSLSSFSSRPANLRLGMGLPMSRVYAEYWAGSLNLHSLEGHGVDAFLQISKLGNQNEQINTRASIDAVYLSATIRMAPSALTGDGRLPETMTLLSRFPHVSQASIKYALISRHRQSSVLFLVLGGDMSTADTRTKAKSKGYSGINSILAMEYRPYFKTVDIPSQCPSEEDHLGPISVPECLGSQHPNVMGHPEPSTQATVFLAAHALSPAMPAKPATAPYWKQVAMPGTYLPSNLAAVPECPSVVAPELGFQGGSGRQRSRCRRLYSARNHFRTRNISLLPPDSKFLAPLNVSMGQGPWSMRSLTAPMDFFVPRVLHSTATSGGALSCLKKLERCTTWRGLSFAGAEELSIWTNIYRLLVKQDSECSRFCMDSSRIAVEMVACYKQASSIGLNWFFSAPNIHSRIERLLSMITAAPSLEIEELEIAVVGQPYTLLPRVVGLSENPIGSFGSEIVFSTSEDWLSFDDSCNVFSGIVPFATPRNIMVKAKVIEYLDERVRLEHVIRGSLCLRAKAPAPPDMYPILVPEERVIDRQTIAKNQVSKKQVSFTDELETASSDSSPDQIRSFLNGLSALTYDSTHEGNSEEFAVTKQLPCEPELITGARCSYQAASAEVKAVDETGHESSTGNSSRDVIGSVRSSLGRQRLARADSTVYLHAHVGQACSKPDEPVGERKAPWQVGGKPFLTGRVGRLCLRQNSALNVQNGCHPKARKYWDNSHIPHNADENLDPDGTLRLSGLRYSVAHHIADSGRSLPLVSRNRSGGIQLGCRLDYPTVNCQPLGCESRSQHGYYQGLTQLQPNFSRANNNQAVWFGKLEDDPQGFYQAGWKGCEQQISVGNRYYYKRPISALTGKYTGGIVPLSLNRDLFEPQLVVRRNTNNSSGVRIEDDTPEPKTTSSIRNGRLLLQALLSAAIQRRVSESSATIWTGECEVAGAKELTNTVDKTIKLYDTFRNQFHNENQHRQGSSPNLQGLLFHGHISPASFLIILSLMNVDETPRKEALPSLISGPKKRGCKIAWLPEP